MKKKLNPNNNVIPNVLSKESISKEINKNYLQKKISKEKLNTNNTLIAVRVRPLNKKEKEESNYKTIKVILNKTLILSIPTEYSFKEKEPIQIIKEKQSSYEYDIVFDENSSQSEVYKYTSYNLIDQILEGYNATVLAYGATGTGKTYTMLGNSSNFGIMIRVIKDLFIKVNKNKNKKYNIKISYIEIYNEIIKDLLSNNNSIVELRTDAKKGLILKNAIIKKVSNEKEAFDIIMKGNKIRTEKNTLYNKNSSRSHAILNIFLEVENQEINMIQNKLFGKFMLLDLAGCEKATFNYNVKNKELGSINKSLLALNKCINLLASKNRGFIPWRDSNLTRILQESLNGNNKFVMINTVSMSLSSFDETIFTLQFAEKAKNLKLSTKKNIKTIENMEIKKYDKYIDNIKEEIVEMKKDIIKQDTSIVDRNNKFELNINNKIEKPKIIIKENNKVTKTDEKFENIYKDMVEHFNLEIKLKKQLIEKEEKIENLKNDMAEKEFEILHSRNINLPPLQKKKKKKKEEINDNKKKLLKGYIKQSELINKRKKFEKFISFLSNNKNNNPDYYNIYNIYKYNINLLENLTIEHKKNINIQESRRKDRKIEGLIEQLDIRDKFIRDAYEQFEKNDIEFKYENPDLIKSNDIGNIYVQPQIIKIKSPKDSFTNLYKNRKLFLKKQNILKEGEEEKVDNKEGNSGKKIFLKKINIKNDKNKNKIDEITNNTKNTEKEHKNELLSIIKKNRNGLNINDFIRKRKVPKDESSLSSYNLEPLSLSPFMKKINKDDFRNRGNISEKMIDNKRINYNQERINIIKNYKNKSMIASLETEIQKKIKTIINKNYIARYKKSPFLRLLNE